jgi:hypothetical protein
VENRKRKNDVGRNKEIIIWRKTIRHKMGRKEKRRERENEKKEI